jgi:hypothetical protein
MQGLAFLHSERKFCNIKRKGYKPMTLLAKIIPNLLKIIIFTCISTSIHRPQTEYQKRRGDDLKTVSLEDMVIIIVKKHGTATYYPEQDQRRHLC